METLYDILNVSKTASLNEIRKEYQRLSLLYHPDKNATSTKFYDIQRAYEILSDLNRRKEYDQEMYFKTKKIVEEIDLDEMTEMDNGFQKQCRCGGMLTILYEHLEKGIEFIECVQCSLVIHVLYEVVD
jgi:curved DNA-binding protein CbpA